MNGKSRTGESYVAFHFIFFAALTALAQLPSAFIFVGMFTAGIGLVALIASPTILLYSAALLPFWIALTNRPRLWVGMAFALLIPAAIAIVPGLLAQKEVQDFGKRLSHGDFAKLSTAKPKSLEISGDNLTGVFASGEAIGDGSAPCSELCRRLLYNHDVEWVRVTRVPMARGVAAPLRSVTYHLEDRDSCPQVYPDGTRVEKEFRNRLAAGQCLIAEASNSTPADAIVHFSTLQHWEIFRAPPNTDAGPDSVRTVKRLVIVQHDGNRSEEIVRRSEMTAQPIVLPFYLGFEFHIQGGGHNGTILGRVDQVINRIDLQQALHDTFGFTLLPIQPAGPEDFGRIRSQALAMLAQPSPVLTPPQQASINDSLGAIIKQPALSDDDVDFIRRVVADSRVSDGSVGLSVFQAFQRYRSRLESLLPVAIERLKIPVPERIGHFQSSLASAVGGYSAGVLTQYRDQIIEIVEAQDGGAAGNLMTRVGELGIDTSEFIADRLEAKSDSARRTAALATCRASDEIWEKLESRVIEHLHRSKTLGQVLPDENAPLVLALIRHDRQQAVSDYVESADIYNKDRMKVRLGKFDAGFAPELCNRPL